MENSKPLSLCVHPFASGLFEGKFKPIFLSLSNDLCSFSDCGHGNYLFRALATSITKLILAQSIAAAF